jgi:hypothetical protein
VKFDPDQVDEAIQYLLAHKSELGSIEIKLNKQRTLTQNGSIHLWCGWMADGLNDSGSDYRHFVEHVMKQGYQVPWSDDLYKRSVWHPIQFAMFPHAVNDKGEPSTAKLSTTEVSQVYEVANRKTGEFAGLTLPFPDKRGR